MGCVCSENSSDKYSIENVFKEDFESIPKINSNLKITNYIKKVYFLINKIRKNPSEFADFVNSSQQYIKEVEDKMIFDCKIKVALNEGKKMFAECAEYLRNLSPMDELIFNDDIVLECPTEPNSIKDINYFKQKVIEKKESQGISAYFKDSIFEPEISVLLMIVDDSIKNAKKKREAVLNPNFKYIGISATDECTDSKTEDMNKDNANNGENNDGNNNSKNLPFCAYFSFK
jgi:hypothetical protein